MAEIDVHRDIDSPPTFGPKFAANDHLDIRSLRASSAFVDERDRKVLTGRFRPQRQRRDAVSQPLVAQPTNSPRTSLTTPLVMGIIGITQPRISCGHRHERQAERLSHPGQLVLDPRTLTGLAVLAALHDARSRPRRPAGC